MWRTIQIHSYGQEKYKNISYICNKKNLAHPNQVIPMDFERGKIKVNQDKFLDSEESQFKFYLSYKSSLKQTPNHGLKKVCHFAFEQLLVEGYICGKTQGVILLKITPKGSGKNHTPLKPPEDSSPTYEEMEEISFRVSKLEDMIKVDCEN